MRRCTVLLLYAMFSVCLKAQLPVSLGSAGNFGVLAGSTVTNTGSTTVTGSLGVSAGSAVSGFPPGVVNGAIHAADATAAQAQIDLTAAF
jgi:Ice-binding-like